MRFDIRRLSTLAPLALMGLVAAGCGGSGDQPSTTDPEFKVASAVAYSTPATVDTLDGLPVVRLALFNGAKTDQSVTIWGSRDATTGAIKSVREAAYHTTGTSAYQAGYVYARYNDVSGLVSVKDPASGAYITFSAVQQTADGPSIVGTAVDNSKTSTATATLTDHGVVVSVISTRSKKAWKTEVSNAELAKLLGKSLASRDAGSDLLNGFTTAYADAEARTKILTAVFRVASALLDSDAGKEFGTALRGASESLLIDQLSGHYADYIAKSGTVSVEADATEPAYATDLPVPTN